MIGVEFKDGLLDLTTQIAFAQKGEEPEVKLSDLNAALRSLRMDVPGESEPLWRVPLLTVKDTTVDIGKRSVVIGSLESRDGNGYVQREQDGTISYARLIKTRAAESATKQPVKEETASWTVDTKRVALNRFRIVLRRSLPGGTGAHRRIQYNHSAARISPTCKSRAAKRRSKPPSTTKGP